MVFGPPQSAAIAAGLRGRVLCPNVTFARAREAAARRRNGQRGATPQRWPIWLKPELVDFDGPPLGPFPASRAITRDGRIALVPTPGRMKGHMSVIVRGEGVTYFLAGDASYNEDNLRGERVDGVTYDPAVSLTTLRRIKRFAAEEPTIYLPARDSDAPTRLSQRTLFRRESHAPRRLCPIV